MTLLATLCGDPKVSDTGLPFDRCERANCTRTASTRLSNSGGAAVWVCIECSIEVEREKKGTGKR